MSSSISSSEPQRWGAFWRATLVIAVGTALFVYLFVVLVDPWGMLPLRLPLPRVPISTNARYSFPALAESGAFDSAIFGTSAVRLLRPAMLDALFGARFANLAMNSATAYEQTRLRGVFLRHHPAPRVVMIGLDEQWCAVGDVYSKFPPPSFQPQPFPEWMYGGSPWRGYLRVMNLYALQESANQFAVIAGLKAQRYGSDGYTSFVGDDRLYDPTRARMHLAGERAPDAPPPLEFDPTSLRFSVHDLLRQALVAIPQSTLKTLFFVPYHVALQGVPGSAHALELQTCKQRIAELVRPVPNLVLADFMIPSPITREDANYWDPHHYRIATAERLMNDLAGAAAGEAPPNGDYALILSRKRRD